jgi:NTE family protein
MPDLPPGAIETDDERPIDLVLEGGGVKGIGLVGALEVLAEHKLVPQRIAGTSAGAITAALLAAGYSPQKMGEILDWLDFASFKDRGLEDRIPLIGYPASVFFNLGVFEGDVFLDWIRGLLADNGVHTFGDLIYEDTADAEFRHSLQVVASDVTGRRYG